MTSESHTIEWLPELQKEIFQFDTSNIDLQSELHRRATDADSVSTFAKEKQPEQPINLVSPENQSKMTKILMPDKINDNEARTPHNQGNMNTSSSSPNALEAVL